MDLLFDGLSAFLGALATMLDHVRAAVPGFDTIVWALTFLLACTIGVRSVVHHMGKQPSLTAAMLGIRRRTDEAGATVFRSAAAVARKPSLSPFYGRPVYFRALPYPLAVLLLWGWIYARPLTAAAIGSSAGWFAMRLYRRAQAYQHNRQIVRPMALALSNALSISPEEVLQGVLVPPNWRDQNARVIIPLPDDHRPPHVLEAVRVTSERLGGEWSAKKAPHSPYYLTLTHKPVPPTRVEVADVAHILLEKAREGKILFGIGANAEPVWGSVLSDAPHLALSAGTQAGKSTLNRWLALQFCLQGATQIGIDVKRTSFDGCEDLPDFHIYNDPERLDLMWAGIQHIADEYYNRSSGKRPAPYRPVYVFLEEQNMFAAMVTDWWSKIRKRTQQMMMLCDANPVVARVLSEYVDLWRLDDPKTLKDLPERCPLWDAVMTLLFMGGEFGIHVVSTYQKMLADAVGGGKGGLGGALRDQYGLKALSRFSPSGWDTVVGTRPRPESPTEQGRWIVNLGSTNRQVQVPNCDKKHMREHMAQLGITPTPALSPTDQAQTPPNVTGPSGDKGTGDTPALSGTTDDLAERVVVPFRNRPYDNTTGSSGSSDNQFKTTIEKEAPLVRFTLREACDTGIIAIPYESAKKARQRAIQRGEYFPEGVEDGKSTRYTAEELIAYFQDRASSK